MHELTRDQRRDYILMLAKEGGNLQVVSSADASAWRGDWLRAVLRVVTPPKPAPVRREFTALPVGRLARKCRAIPLPPAMAVPGTWLKFRPHAFHPVEPHIYQVVAVVERGQSLMDVLGPDQFRMLDHHTLPGPSPRYTRVIVSVWGTRKATGCLKAVLAGELAARAEIIPAPEHNDSSTRLASPLLPGSQASWLWHSLTGAVRHEGVILGFVPAGTAIADVLPDLDLPWGIHQRSNQDRYLVQPSTWSRKRILTPAAHLVEREVLELQPLEAPAEAALS